MLLVPLLLISVGTIFALAQSHRMLIAGLILCCAMPFGGVTTISVLFQLRVDNRIPMLIMTLRSIVWGVAVLLIYLDHGTIVALAIALVVSGLVTNGLQALLALRMVGRWPRPSRRRLRELVGIGVPMGISGVLIISYAKIDQVFVFTIAGSRQAGLYGAVYNVLDQAHFVPMSILTTLNPVLAAAWPRDRERLLRAARMTAELLAIASFGALAFAIAGAEPVLRAIFGASFTQAAPTLVILGAAYVLISFGYLNGNLLITLGQQRRLMRISLVALVVNLAGNAVLVPLVGYIGAAVMTLVTEAVVIAMASYWVLHTLELRRPSPGRISRTAAAAVILGLLLGAERLAGAGLPILIPTACVLYPALLYAVKAFELEDVRTVMRRGQPA
jgi:O-antigen/teichoic acid export membrane protein